MGNYYCCTGWTLYLTKAFKVLKCNKAPKFKIAGVKIIVGKGEGNFMWTNILCLGSINI